VFGINWWQKFIEATVSFLVTGLVVTSLIGCSDRSVEAIRTGNDTQLNSVQRSTKIAEVSPPQVIQQLRQSLEIHRPQVTILSPQPDEVLQDTTVNIRLQVQDLPIFKNQELDLGPHLNVILDNQPYTNIYNLSEPLVFSGLTPGTHTLRVFATYPWNESFKNEGAYTQTTFHVFAKDNNNSPAPNKPLLTYNTPQGTFSAEPVLLDFYLTNAPLHLVAQENQQSDVTDWRIRCTINGESFILERWQPLYLQGFQPGKNWVQLEFIDEQGNFLPNVFNNTVRLVTYEPSTEDSLGKLVKGQLSVAEARGIVEQNYVYKSPIIEPTPTPSPTPPELPSVEETKLPEQQALDKTEVNQPEQKLETDLEKTEQTKPNNLFNRFRRHQVEPAPSVTPLIPEIPEESEIPDPETIPEELQVPAPEQTIPVEPTEPQSSSDIESLTPLPAAVPPEISSPVPTPALEGVKSLEKPPNGFFSRFRRRSVISPSSESPQSEVIDLPVPRLETLESPQEEAADDQLEPNLEP
jgi:hypothetical protein